MRVQKAMIDDTISVKKAGLLLYSLQLAITNVGQTTFGEADERELVTDLVDEEEAISKVAISNQRSAFSQGEKPLTTEDAEERKPGKTLPLINTDDTDRRGLPRINAEERGLEEKLENVLAMRVGGAVDCTPEVRQ